MGRNFFFLRHRVQTVSGARPVSYPMDTGTFRPRIKQPGRKTDHPLASSDEVKNARKYEGVSESFRTGRLERELQICTALCH